MDTFVKDVRYSIRKIFQMPGFSLIVILSLAIGIGVNTAIFSVVNGVLIRPLSYKDPDRLVVLIRTSSTGPSIYLSPVNFQEITSQGGIFTEASAINTETFNITGKAEPERIEGASVSWNFFHVLGIHPAVGRGFTAAEGQSGRTNVAIISSSYWQKRYGGAADILGKTITVDGRAMTIVGVAPPGLNFPEGTRVWLPIIFSAEDMNPSQRGAHWIRVIGRLKEGLPLQRAQQKMEEFGIRYSKAYPRTESESRPTVMQMRQHMVRDVRQPLSVLLGAVAFVLLIACANVMNLLLAQKSRRQTELAIRIALGASRFRLVRQLLVETLMLTLLAGIAGLLIASWSIDVLRTIGPSDLPRLQEVNIDRDVFFFTLFISILTGLIVGLLPALQSTKNEIAFRMGASGRRIIPVQRLLRKILVVGEVALALVLLTGAGLLIRSFANLQEINPGFNARGVESFSLSLPFSKYEKKMQIDTFYSRLMERLESHREIQSAGMIFGLPLTDLSAASSFEIKGRPQPRPEDEPSGGLRVVTSDYFRTMGIPIRRGRSFEKTDMERTAQVAIINEAAARRFWPNEVPIGQHIRIGVSLIGEKSEPREIIGICGNVRYEGLDIEAGPEVYIPHSQQPVNMMTVVIRSSNHSSRLASLIRSEVRGLDPDVPIWNLRSMEEVISASTAERRFTMLLLTVFAGVAIILAAMGIYGVLSYTVAQRIGEIGLRMALGAQRRDVLRLVMEEGFVTALMGAMIGLIGALAVTRVLASQLFHVGSTDPLTLVLVVSILCSIAALASYFPARKAMKVDPMMLLRYE